MSPPHDDVVVPHPDSQALVCGQNDSHHKKYLETGANDRRCKGVGPNLAKADRCAVDP